MVDEVKISFGKGDLEDFNEVRLQIAKKMEKDKIIFLEQRGYKVVLNNTGEKDSRNQKMITILEADGYKVTKEKIKKDK